MKKCLLIILSFISTTLAMGQKVTKEMAIDVSNQYFYAHYTQGGDIKKNKRVEQIRQIDSLYVIQYDDGWSIVPNNMYVRPILASSTKGHFSLCADSLPCGLTSLLDYYNNVIRYSLDSNNVVHHQWNSEISLNNRNNEDVVLERMQEIKWGQSYNNNYSCTPSYNQLCPNFNNLQCGHNYVGCGAVAVGQILWYYQWPHAAIVPKNMLDSLGNTSDSILSIYDWNNTPSALYNNTQTEQANNIAKLLRDCGFASHSRYHNGGTTSYVSTLNEVLNDYFDYSCNYQYFPTAQNDDLTSIVKSEIDSGRPVILRGCASNGANGHFFIAYGYDNDDKLYINWGWNGAYQNATYAVDNLIAGGYDFSFGKYAIKNIQPQPICAPVSINIPQNITSDFKIISGNNISISNMTIEPGCSGVIYSGKNVVLEKSIEIKAGSEVIIDIKDSPCE